MNIKLIQVLMLAVLGLIVGGAFELLKDDPNSRNSRDVYGEWVAVSGLCNGTLSTNVDGLDINPGYLVKNGAKTSFQSMEVVEKVLITESCSIGPALYEIEVILNPISETFLVGLINDFPVVKDSKGVVYFKMSHDFKIMYESMREKLRE